MAGVTARRISLVANPKTGSTGVLSLNGLNVFASCSAAGNAGLTAQSAVSGGDLRVSVVTSSTTTHTGSDASFNTPNTFDLTRTAPFGTGELNFINKTNGQVVSATTRSTTATPRRRACSRASRGAASAGSTFSAWIRCCSPVRRASGSDARAPSDSSASR